MSAIWGAIQLNGEKISPLILEKMEEPVRKYSIDRYEKIVDEAVVMGCGIQYFNKEALFEKLPIKDKNIYFDADVVLDNRMELIKKLQLTNQDTSLMSDGEILFRMISKYGDECLNDLLGAYSFVYYDRKENKVRLVSDSVGNRTLYYKVEGDILYYSSLIESINFASECKMNDKWFVDFLAMDFTRSYADQEQTPYEGIYRVATASEVVITKAGVKKNRYWNPLEKIKTRKYKNDEDVEKEFRELWKTAVRCVMRTEDEVSILLSGGLDSTAVASEASPFLKEKGKELYSFTSVPLDEHEAERGKRIDDESEEVLKSAEYYGNINVDFIKLEGVNSWNGYDKQMDILEMPYKASLNALWMQEACLKARKKGARLLLTGGYGNNCLSYSGTRRYCNYLFRKFHWLKLYKTISDINKTMGVPRKVAVKGIIRDAFIKDKIPTELYGDSYVNRDYADELKSDILIKEIYKSSRDFIQNYKARYDLMVDWMAMRQIGELTMKLSLYSGVLIRDPSNDKRLIEFCVNLPYEQFDKDGIDRRLVKWYLRDQIPEHVNRYVGRGRQSADMKLRIELDWDNIYREWIEGYSSNSDSHIVDINKALDSLEEKDCIETFEVADINRHVYTLKALEFYNNHKVVTIIDR